MAIPRLAERIGVTPRVLRYWEEQQLISPTREHGKLRYSPRDLAIAALVPAGPACPAPGWRVSGCSSDSPSATPPCRRYRGGGRACRGGAADPVPAQGLPRGNRHRRRALPRSAGRHPRHPLPTGRPRTDPEPAASPGAHRAAPPGTKRATRRHRSTSVSCARTPPCPTEPEKALLDQARAGLLQRRRSDPARPAQRPATAGLQPGPSRRRRCRRPPLTELGHEHVTVVADQEAERDKHARRHSAT